VALLDIRQRSGYLLVAVIIGHVLLISAQVNSQSGVPMLETVTFGVIAEFQRGAGAVSSTLRGLWDGYFALREVQAENERLRQALAETDLALQEQRAIADRTRGLEELLALRDQVGLTTVAAEVIAVGASPEFRTITVDKGAHDGLATDMAVLAPRGIVGRVVVVSPRAAMIQLLVDRNAAAGALISRSRAQGLVMGRGDDRLGFDYVSELSDVEVGDHVVTSGIDGIYPKGFVVGQVEAVERAGVAFRNIVVKPAVDFTQIEQVLIVTAPAAVEDPAEPVP
jgi:rod shape-determining protein MreC